MTTRLSNSVERFSQVLGRSGAFWAWIVVSVFAFVVLTSVASVVDLRMWELRRQGSARLSRFLAMGIRTFWRLLVDRRTPLRARALLLLSLLYWLAPVDLVSDAMLFPGFAEDSVIAVLGAKGFLRMCPDDLVAQVAARVSARSH